MISILPTARDVELNQPWNHSERRDEMDVPPECRLGQVFVRDEPFHEDTAEEFESELHELYVRGSVRFRVKA